MGNTGAKDAKAEHNAPPLIESRSSLDKGAKAAQLEQAGSAHAPLESPTNRGRDRESLRPPGLDHELISDADTTTTQPTPIASPGHHRALFPRKPLPGQRESHPIPADLQSDPSQPNAAGLAEMPDAAPAVAQPPLEDMLPPLDSGATDHAAPSNLVVEGAKSEHPVATKFQWRKPAKHVSVAGTFNRWEEHVPLDPQGDGTFSVIIHLPPGEYQYKFFVDGEWQHDDDAPMCSNSLGSINNLVKIVGSTLRLSGDDSLLLIEDSTDGRASPEGDYGQEIPELWNAKPPTLPPQLLNVTLNAQHPSNDPTQLPEPHHVMLSHLYALSIKDNVIVLGCTNRYRKKYVTTVLYKPFET